MSLGLPISQLSYIFFILQKLRAFLGHDERMCKEAMRNAL
jgi:hypothetical protein